MLSSVWAGDEVLFARVYQITTLGCGDGSVVDTLATQTQGPGVWRFRTGWQVTCSSSITSQRWGVPRASCLAGLAILTIGGLDWPCLSQ